MSIMAENVKYRFIENIGDYFPSDYFGEDFLKKVQQLADYNDDQMKALCPPYVQLKEHYTQYKNFIVNQTPRIKDAILRTNEFHKRLLTILGYAPEDKGYNEKYIVSEEGDKTEIIPVRNILRTHNKVQMLIMEMRPLIKVGEDEPAGLFQQQYDDGEVPHQRYSASHWESVFTFDKEHERISPSVINKAISQIFLMPEEKRPQYILMLAGSKVMLLDQDKWARGSYLVFSLDELFSQASISAFRNYYALFHLLVCKDTLAAESETLLMSSLIEDSYRNAYSVTQDLKQGVVKAVETIANEALYYMKHVAHQPFGKRQEDGTYDETDDRFEAEVKDDCLTLVYRLLFIFYAESRQELEILPTNDEVYNKGYSLDMLRDLEQVNLVSQQSRDGYFFDDSIKTLFYMLSHGINEGVETKAFRVIHIDSPMFDDSKLNHLNGVKLRNQKWQEIIRSLSLSNRDGKCGRISYANLGINQLGSVYESLLAYRGFYAEEDYIEVHKANEPQDGTFLVPYSRFEAFDLSEVLTNKDGMPIILKKGTFVYRLNGRDRQKSASYYTPEVLTRSTVKYTLKGILERVEKGEITALELLNMKILEPAMGAAAFQNEVINQLSEAYLTYRSKELREQGREKWRIEPDKYRDELQKVKAYIATHNVYGVDLNPTAIELGKLSLWLNVIHKDMETPFFSNRLALGNAVIGAWLKVYDKSEVVGTVIRGKKTLQPNEWWVHAPHRLHFKNNRIKRNPNEIYHFLLPDKNMLGVRAIKEQKAAHPIESALMSQKLAQWTAALSSEEFKRLQRLSSKIEILLREYVEFQMSIEKLTENRYALWGTPGKNETSMLDSNDFVDTYREKQELNDTRYRHDNAYYRLKMVMDYWCSLWFWEYDDANSLPSREDYWNDIEAMLDVSDEKLNKGAKMVIKPSNLHAGGEQMRMFEEETQLTIGDEVVVEESPYEQTDEETSVLLTKTKQEILAETQGQQSTLFDNPQRFRIVAKLAKRYHFFHPMLEFAEVFWLRDGFDIICGNPPWIKVEFDEQGILSDKYPEVAIRKMSAPDVRKMRERMFNEIPQTEIIYREEELDTACSSVFLNAHSNYPLLAGQQTNLYKCVIENGFSLISENGYMGLLHPETVYDDPNGQPLRVEIYRRLRYHFQYQNALNLFAEVAHRERYSSNIYSNDQNRICFSNINNLFHPSTIDACFSHDGHGMCGGIKVNEKWNLEGHKKRIVQFTDREIALLSNTFEDGTTTTCAKLVNFHSTDVIGIIQKLSSYPTSVSDAQCIISECFHETGALDAGILKRETRYPEYDKYEMLYNGPQIFINNPCYKTPRKTCANKGDFDTIDLSTIDENYLARTNYIPLLRIPEYKAQLKGFPCGQDDNGDTIYDEWIEYYKVGFRKMMNQAGERTLIGAILPKKTAHINGVISATFQDNFDTVDLAALSASVVMDFYMKTIAAQNLTANRMSSFPHGVPEKYKAALYSRSLMLNCLTKPYSLLWEECWREDYRSQQWSIDDSRLKPFSALTKQWSWDIPLRNYFERHQALVEIDVITAMALGLSLEDLEMIYTIQFPVLQQNENDTWYDAEGKIVFTCSKGLTGVGLDRPVWDSIKGEISEDGLTAKGVAPTYEHTITKSELYQGQKQTFVAPYTCCDRIADYRRAWAHFEKLLK